MLHMHTEQPRQMQWLVANEDSAAPDMASMLCLGCRQICYVKINQGIPEWLLHEAWRGGEYVAPGSADNT